MRKRISALLLAFMVMFSAYPALTFAETDDPDADGVVAVEAEEAEAVEEAAPEEEAVEEAAETAEEEAVVEEEAEAVEEAAPEVVAAPEAKLTKSGKSLTATNEETSAQPETSTEEAAEETLAITGLGYTEKTSKYVVLTWTLKRGDAVYSKNDKKNLLVYVKEDGGKFEKKDVSIKFDSSSSTYTAKVTGLTPNTKYKFRVREKAEKVKAEKSIRTEKAVPNVQGFKAMSTYNGIMLKWKRVQGATGYTIKWKSGSKSGKIKIKKGSTVKYLHKLPKNLRTKKVVYSIVGTRTGYYSSPEKATAKGEAVRTMYVSFVFNTTRTLTSHDKAKKTTVFPKGTKIESYGYNWGRYIFDYKGHTYYVKRYSVSGQDYSQLNTKKTYTKAEAELFVNSRGLKSNTNTLIWANTYTQKLYLFRGSKGKWKLYKGPWDVCTGKAKTPTPTGLTRVKSKTVGCHDPFPQTPWWCVTAQFSIHGKAPYYPAMGKPASNGCVRNWSENAKWMYYNVPVGTAVYIF